MVTLIIAGAIAWCVLAVPAALVLARVLRRTSTAADTARAPR